MSGPSLFDTMTAQVDAECKQHAADASAQAEQIHSEADAQSRARREAVLKATAAEKDLLDLRARQKAATEASKAELSMRNDTVEAILARVDSEIRRIVDSPEFPGVLDALLGTLMQAADGEFLVLAPEAHVAHVQQWLNNNGHAGVTVQGSKDTWDGVALQDHAQTYRVSNTLTGRFSRVASEARRHSMIALFGTAEGA